MLIVVGAFLGTVAWGFFLVFLSPGSSETDRLFGGRLARVAMAAALLGLGASARKPALRYVFLGLAAVVGIGAPLVLILGR